MTAVFILSGIGLVLSVCCLNNVSGLIFFYFIQYMSCTRIVQGGVSELVSKFKMNLLMCSSNCGICTKKLLLFGSS